MSLTNIILNSRAKISGLFFLVMLFGLICSPTGSGKAMAGTQIVPATFADVAEKASPAVVNVSIEKKIEGLPFGRKRDRRGKDLQDPFNDFFERFFGDNLHRRERKESSLGSGFLVSPQGLILTNNHVVEGADEILVKLSNEKEYKAEVIGRDAKTDLALIKIKAKVNLPYLTLGDSNKLRIGDWVVAIGNPFGLEHTVTAGILSGRGRSLGAGPYDDFLQTDASINFGNSGGPLLNMDGEVIGINTAIVAGGTGIGFAIPTNLAQKVVRQLEDNGKVVRGWLGVMIQKVTPELAKTFQLDGPIGALVADVTPGGPADKAGIKRGDVIVDFDGQAIEDFSELPVIVADVAVGTKVKVTVVREGKKEVFSVVIGELVDEEPTISATSKGGRLGLSVEELTPETAKGLGLSESTGVVIEDIEGNSPAADSGLNVGDLIIEINREPVKSMADYRRLTGEVEPGSTVLFLVRRGANTLFFTLEMEE